MNMIKAVYPIVTSVGFLAVLLLYLAGVGYQKEVFDLGQAFTILRYCAYAGLAGAGLSIFYILSQRPVGIKLGLIFISAVRGITAYYLPYRQSQIAGLVPPIHDITTDIANPPAFVAIAPLRASAPNPAEYAGEETAAQQREAYPDLMSILYIQSPAEVFTSASELVAEMGWEMVDANEGDGRIEATVTTQWFGFKDDVVIRLSPGSAGSTIFDMRSKSRVGRSDIGVNAGRIRSFTQALNQRLR